jgi:hypothetical protein
MNHVAEEDVTVLLNVWAGDDPRSLQQCLQSVFVQIGVKISLFIILDSPITKDLREVIAQCEKLANPFFRSLWFSTRSRKALARSNGRSRNMQI